MFRTQSDSELDPTRADLAAEAVAVKIRWFGLAIGYMYVAFGSKASTLSLSLLLTLGLFFTVFDTYYSWRGKVFLGGYPLLISLLEAIFIGLLCFNDGGLESPFRCYYILSLICAAIRYTPLVTGITFALDFLSYAGLFLALPSDRQSIFSVLLGLIVLGWVTWAAVALARLLRRVGDQLAHLNAQLREDQSLLEVRISERTRELQESQAQVHHQEKMAAFGLLAAGIAHEVGNPLTSISTLIQLLERRDPDAYTRERLCIMTTQLARIQNILRELVAFSRPASPCRNRVSLKEIVDEAIGIAKYYTGVKGREVRAEVPVDLPLLHVVRDQLVQVFFNLLLNAIDATSRGGKVLIAARAEADRIVATVSDDGHGIDPIHRNKLFHPYFTTKKTGTGLGLFVTQKLVQSHGGHIEFHSTPGEGTSFSLSFPINLSWDTSPWTLGRTPTMKADAAIGPIDDFSHSRS